MERFTIHSLYSPIASHVSPYRYEAHEQTMRRAADVGLLNEGTMRGDVDWTLEPTRFRQGHVRFLPVANGSRAADKEAFNVAG